jgi:hypothetical protein
MPATVAPTRGIEGEQEDEHGQRDNERHAHDREADPDADRVDRRHDRRPALVAAERADCRRADPLTTLVPVPLERPRQELPYRRAVLQEEEQDDDHDEEARDEVGGMGDARDGTGTHGVGLQQAHGGLADRRDLLVGYVEGQVLDVGLQRDPRREQRRQTTTAQERDQRGDLPQPARAR